MGETDVLPQLRWVLKALHLISLSSSTFAQDTSGVLACRGEHSRFAMWANAMWAIDGSALPFCHVG
jgi:hypothetical protein